ncbi:PTS glucose transporter subunit IIA [Schaalia sp. 19OD2882]|uniref:glucose PTS transporter subunit IIA n=1 Tax=Schaalia sp. 19OD2882 TaxID=2794089 RepID=UPI001C1E9251|nr:glucose PTS transporter subunit IIA [Schaalia sp. 19OD2882]QWW20218.1 PTS glucose transporter subunit IIA [Schaalia sp. 19OD2882]
MSTADNEPILSPLAGEIVPIDQVPDPVFSSKTMGDGFGVAPTGGAVVAPVSGTVTMVARTKHAFGMKTESGVEILVHMGIDTVELDGAPFTLQIAKGDVIAADTPVATMDLAAVEAAGKSTMTVVVFTNQKKHGGKLELQQGKAELGAQVAAVSPAQAAKAQAAPAARPAAQEDDPARAGLQGFDLLAYDIIKGVGGQDNIKSVIHCITRVRFYLKDDSLADEGHLKSLDIIDVAKAGGQFQVVIGQAVADVYEAITKQLGGAGDDVAEEVEKPTTILGWVKFGFSSLIGVITGSMIPVVGLLAASGILKGILALLTEFNLVQTGTSTYTIIDAMSSSMFYFLPIIIGFTAAKRLGSDPIVVAIIGGVLVFPSIVTMSNPKSENYNAFATFGNTVFNAEFFGIPISLPLENAYAYSIFPVIVAAWLAAKIEPVLKKYIPLMLRSIFAPLIEVFVVSALVLVVFGPIIMFISGGLADGVNSILSFNYPVAGLIIGGLYQCLVIFGLHWAVIPLVASQISIDGSSPLNAILSATMIAQGGGAMAIWLKTKNSKIKALAGPATISAFCGITEPAMYGLNLKYGRVFMTASLGGAVGGLLTGLFDVNMWGFPGAFVGFPSFINPNGIDGSFTGYWIASFATLLVSFTATYLFGFKETDFETAREVKKVRLGRREPAGA